MLKQFLENFLSYVPLQLPELLDVTKMEKEDFSDDQVVVTFHTPNAYTLDEVMDIIDDDMELIMLYHHIPSDQSEYKHSTCAYSNPAFGQMFKINAATDTSGFVNEVSVTIYGDLEYMCSDICLDLEKHNQRGIMKYKRDKEDVLLNFL